jgi:hypothetical protein
LSQKNDNISLQGIQILDVRAVLETSLNSTKNFERRKWDSTTKYVSKKALKLTDAKKKLSKILWGKKQTGFDWSLFGTPLTILFESWLQENRAKKPFSNKKKSFFVGLTNLFLHLIWKLPVEFFFWKAVRLCF